MLTKAQRDKVTDLVLHIGTTCIAPAFGNLKDGDVHFKESQFDPVSVFDVRAEAMLRDGLQLLLPGSFFLGEESCAKDPSLLKLLEQTDTPVWVADPIDGTDNFVNKRPGFGIMLCLVNQGKILSSWFYEVSTKTLSVAHAGEGFQINGQPLVPLSQTHNPFTGLIGWKLLNLPEVHQLREGLTEIDLQPARHPSIVAYQKLIEGELDFLIYRKTYPWDHLPGIGLTAEFGFVSARWDGCPYEFADISHGLIVARNDEIMDKVRTQIIQPLSNLPVVMKFGS